MNKRYFTAFSGGLLIAMLAFTPRVTAQDALGAGDALDSSLNRLTGRRNQAVPPIDYRARNLLVTHDIAGGRGFRGTVGYTAADDFRSILGSDDLFRFRSYSALSSLGVIRYGNTYRNLQLGQGLGMLEYRRVAGTSLKTSFLSERQFAGDLVDAEIQLDRVAQRQSNAQRHIRRTEPSLLGMALSQEGQPLMFSASSLRGLAMTPVDDDYQPSLSSYDRARLQQDTQRGQSGSRIGLSSQMLLSDLLVPDTRVDASIGDDRRRLTADEEYISILQRIADRYASDKNVDLNVQSELLTGLTQQFEELRTQLSRKRTTPEQDKEPRPAERLSPDFDPERRQAPVVVPPKTAPKKGIERFGVILKHGERIEHFATDRTDRFSELMRTAEERLTNSEYFWAEQRFHRALRIMPDHPLALAGVGHAQLGAGLYLPAALTLRRLLTIHPEMIDVAYAENLLPSTERLIKAVSELRQRIDQQHETAPYGFLLAYLGHQIEDRSMIEEGLQYMATALNDEAFVTLLQSVWSDK